MINIKGATKKFGDFTAISDINITVKKGTVFGFIGENGADRKSTRLNSRHTSISYAVFCLKKKNRSPESD